MLKISHISKTFNPGTVNEKKAIEDLSLELKKGDFATIIGSNGAGKSTLGYALMGNPRYTVKSGEIWFKGKNITAEPVNERAKDGIFLSFRHLRC